MSNQPTGHRPEMITAQDPAADQASVTEQPGDLGSPDLEAWNAFCARWNLVNERVDVELWDFGASPHAVSVVIARHGAAEESAVDVCLQDDRVRLSASTTGAPVDLAATARALQLPANEVRETIQPVVEALHYAREVYRLADQLYDVRSWADRRERDLDRAASVGGKDAEWLKDPQAQRERLNALEAARDRFAATHGLSGLTASDLDDFYGLAQDIQWLTQERDDLADAGLAGWLRETDVPASRTRGLTHLVTVLPRLVYDVVEYFRHTRRISRGLDAAHERQRIASGLFAAQEDLSDAQGLRSAVDAINRLRREVIAAVQEASTPTKRPGVPNPYRARPVLASPNTLNAPTLRQPGPARPRPELSPPGM